MFATIRQTPQAIDHRFSVSMEEPVNCISILRDYFSAFSSFLLQKRLLSWFIPTINEAPTHLTYKIRYDGGEIPLKRREVKLGQPWWAQLGVRSLSPKFHLDFLRYCSSCPRPPFYHNSPRHFPLLLPYPCASLQLSVRVSDPPSPSHSSLSLPSSHPLLREWSHCLYNLFSFDRLQTWGSP